MPRLFALLVVAATFSLGLQVRYAAGFADDPPAKASDGADAKQPRLTVAEIVAQCEPSVAAIEGKRIGGTGFLVRRNLLVTNAHVIANESIQDVRVRFPSAPAQKQGPYEVDLVEEDRGRDLAFLAIKTELPPLRLADSFKYVKGDDVTVIGNPGVGGKMILENAISRGVMSTKATIDGQDFYQLNIAVNPGNSGGPVFDARGHVIGVVTLKLSQREGIALCIPVEKLVPKVADAERKMRSMAATARRPAARDRPPAEAKGGGGAVQLKSMPDAKAVEVAQKEVRELFEAELKQATMPGQQIELAQKLVEASHDAEGDAAAQYALLNEARLLASHAGDLEVSLHLIDVFRETFEGLSLMNLEVETLEEVSRYKKSSDERLELAKAALDRVNLAIEKDEYDAARRLIDLAKSDKTALPPLADAVKKTAELVDKLGAQFQKIQVSLKTLEKDPNDSVANLAVGSYRTLWKGDWERGLPMMAKGPQEPLAEIARRDLAQPSEPVDQGRLGDSWWEQAGKLTDSPRAFAQQRAVEWYDRCVDNLPGLVKIRTKKRLDEYAATADARKSDLPGRPIGTSGSTRPGLVAEFFEGTDFRRRLTWRIDPNVDFNWGDGSPDSAVPKDFFGVRWTGYLRPPTAGIYTLKLKSDNGLRWVLGDRVIYDELSTNGHHEREITIDLKAQPQLMRVDFLDGVFTSWCHLYWRRPGQSDFEPIPAKCFTHNKDQLPADPARR